MSMTVITIRQTGDLEASPNATVSFDGRGATPVTIRDPFAEGEESLLEWYFEEYLKFPFTREVQAKQAAQSITRYGEALFAQVFKQDFNLFGQYSQARQQGLERLRFEIIGSPIFTACTGRV